MEIETITKLIDAGYTKAEIDALSAEAGTPKGEGAGETTPPTGEEQGNAGEKNASEINQPVEITAAIEALTNTVAGLKETVKAMQDANAGKAATDKPKKDTIGEAMKSFIDTL